MILSESFLALCQVDTSATFSCNHTTTTETMNYEEADANGYAWSNDRGEGESKVAIARPVKKTAKNSQPCAGSVQASRTDATPPFALNPVVGQKTLSKRFLGLIPLTVIQSVMPGPRSERPGANPALPATTGKPRQQQPKKP